MVINKKNSIVTFIKKNKVSLSVILLLLIAAFSFQYFNKTSYALSEPVTGTSGTCQWTIDTDGKMTIEPQSGESSCTLGVVSSYDAPWQSNKTDVISVEVKQGVIANANSRNLFFELNNLASIDVSELDTSNVTSMAGMFYECNSLTELDLSSFVTENVTNMSEMFFGCESLIRLDLSNFATNSVTTFFRMFDGCISLEELDITSFNTTNVTNMERMFQTCRLLTNLDLTNFNTTNVTSMDSMFAGCSSLKQLDITSFNTTNVTSMAGMFYGCSSLKELDLSSFVTDNVTSMKIMFASCSSLIALNLSNFDMGSISSASSIYSMFSSLGSSNNEGCKLVLNKTFDNATYATNSGYYFPYAYYAKETSGVLSNKLYTLSEMQTDVTGSDTPTTWVPAYSVTYNGNTGTISGNNTLVKIYRIGSKINTRGVTPVKNNYEFANWKDTQNGRSATITINKNGSSTNAYGSKYTSVGTNGNITLYAQYNLPVSDVEFYKKDDVTGNPVSGAAFSLTGTSDAGTSVSKTATSGNDGKVTFTDVPFGTYRVHETTVPTGYNSNNLRDFNVTVSE